MSNLIPLPTPDVIQLSEPVQTATDIAYTYINPEQFTTMLTYLNFIAGCLFLICFILVMRMVHKTIRWFT
jgi:hypothetical protein